MANGDSKSYRTYSLVILIFVGAFLLAILTKEKELVYAYGAVSGGALAVWVGGKFGAGYTAMTEVVKTTQAHAEAATKQVQADAAVAVAKAEGGS